MMEQGLNVRASWQQGARLGNLSNKNQHLENLNLLLKSDTMIIYPALQLIGFNMTDC